jgi:hypothetical protein
MHLRFLLVAFAVVAVPASALAATMTPGLWTLTMTAEAEGRTDPLPEVTQCVSQQDVDDDTRTLPRPQGSCTLTNVKRGDPLTTYELACLNGTTQSRGRAEMRFTGDRYDGTVIMAMSERGRPAQKFVMKISARRIGDCNK